MSDNTLFKFHNLDTGKTVYVNLTCLAWIVEDGANLLIGLNDGNRFHIQEKLRDLPMYFTNLLK